MVVVVVGWVGGEGKGEGKIKRERRRRRRRRGEGERRGEEGRTECRVIAAIFRLRLEDASFFANIYLC